jgi:hypothetical protein
MHLATQDAHLLNLNSLDIYGGSTIKFEDLTILLGQWSVETKTEIKFDPFETHHQHWKI